MVLSPDVLPQNARRLAGAFTDALVTELGEELVSLFTYGSAVFGGWPANDFDSHAFVDGTYDEARGARIDGLMRDLAERFGMSFDSWFIAIEQARGRDDPTHLRGEPTDRAWALHRAHVRAGKFVLLHGADPRTIVEPPTDEEIRRSLRDVLRDCCESSYHGYAVLNMCRLWCSLELGDVVLSKRQAALWALGALPQEWHPLVVEAVRWYERRDEGHSELLSTEAPRLIAAYRGMLERRLA